MFFIAVFHAGALSDGSGADGAILRLTTASFTVQ